MPAIFAGFNPNAATHREYLATDGMPVARFSPGWKKWFPRVQIRYSIPPVKGKQP